MNDEKINELKRLRFEDYIWVAFITLSILDIVADNYQKKFFVSFVKVIRILAIFITIFAPGIYLSLITYDQQMLPTSLLINFSIQRASVPFPAAIEALLLISTFEILYEGDALTPSSRGTSLSILGAIVLGDAAVSAGIVSPIMVIVVAITAISSIFFVYYFQSQ